MITFFRCPEFSMHHDLHRTKFFPDTVDGRLVDFHHPGERTFEDNAEFLAPYVEEMGIPGITATSGGGSRALAGIVYHRLWHPHDTIYAYCPEQSLHLAVLPQLLKWMSQNGDWILETFTSEMIAAASQVLLLDLAEVRILNLWRDDIEVPGGYFKRRYSKNSLDRMADSMLGSQYMIEEQPINIDIAINNPNIWKLELEATWPFTGMSPSSETKKRYF